MRSLLALAAVAALGAVGVRAAAPSPPPGTPAVVTRNAAGWPAPNHDYANTRDAATSPISAATAKRLHPVWRFDLSPSGIFGSFSSNPVVADGRVYLQTNDSTVFALDARTGKRIWTHVVSDTTGGPNGPALGDGVVVAVDATSVFALDARNGHLRWRRDITQHGFETVDMAPLVWNGLVVVSSATGAYRPGSKGVVYGLDLKTGKIRWQFDTTTNALWGHPELNSGGGLWYPPAVDAQGRLYMGVGNPAPFPGTPDFPDGSSRPGPNLYTDSLVVLDGRSGKLRWYYQALPHDLLDHDLQEPPILTRFTIGGRLRDVVVVGGKMGTVYVLDRATHKLLWKRDVGQHNAASKKKRFGNDLPVTVYPGILGGLIAPMAVADGTIYASVLDLCATVTAQKAFPDGISSCALGTARSELVALDGATGRVLWVRKSPHGSYAGATVTRDLVIVADFDGTVSLVRRRDGKLVRTLHLPAGTNGTPAVAGDLLVVGAGVRVAGDSRPAVVAYRL
jgi:glucose dehydrogenase